MSDIAEIMGEKFSADDLYLPSGVFAKEQPLAIIGAPGVGKSLLLLQMAVCFLTGRPFLGWPIKRHESDWMLLQTENNRRRMQNVLAGYKNWLSPNEWKHVEQKLHIPRIVEGYSSFFPLSEPESADFLRQVITPKQPGVVVFDPISSFAAGSLNSYAGMTATLQAFAELANCGAEGCSLIVLHHALTGMEGIKKSFGFNRGSFGRDSKALNAWVRGQINIVPQSEQDNSKLVAICGKNNNGEEFKPFGIKLDRATMIYEVDTDFDLEEWMATVRAEPAAAHRPTPRSIAALLTTPMKRAKLMQSIMDEFGCHKTHAYNKIADADGKTIKRNRRGLYEAIPSKP